MNTATTVVDALQGTRNMLATHGVGRNAFCTQDGKFCTIGALSQFSHGDMYVAAKQILRDTLDLLYDGDGSREDYRIAKYNDTHNDSEVLEFIDRAIALAQLRNGYVATMQGVA